MRSISSSSYRSERGSVLLVCLIFAGVIAISLGSFLQVATTASRLSYRTYYLGAAMNIAETGLEQATWSMNQLDQGESDGWDGWTASGAAYTRSFTLDKLEGGASAVVKVHATPASPRTVLVRAIVTPPRGAPIEKYLKVKLTKRSLFSVGGLGRDGISASGNNVVMGSWNSDPDKNDATPYIPFSTDVDNDKMSLASTEIDAEIGTGQADVNGSAAVGARSSEAGFDITDYVKVGSQGYIGPEGTTPGTLDPDSVSADFTADLVVIEPPTGKTYASLGSIGTDLELPRSGDSPDADGYYYYTASQINLNGTTLSISAGANVVVVVPNRGDISIGGGSGSINIGSELTTNTSTGTTTYVPSSLEIYASGNIDIGGKGSANEVTLQTYTPAVTTATTTTTTVTTTTVISNVTEVKGNGSPPKPVIGWKYDKKVTTVTTVGSGSPVTATQTYNNLQNLISNSDPQPVAGTTSTTDSYVSNASTSTPEITTTVGTRPGQPKNFRIYGTRTDEEVETYGNQSIKISGNGSLSGVIYAPNGDISAKGGGNSGFVHGSLVGASLTFTGNDCFYYDESLADLGGDAGFKFESWEEFSVSSVDGTEKAKLEF